MFYNVQNAQNVTATAQQICSTLLKNLDDAVNFWNWLSAQPDTVLTGLGFTSGDVNTLRAAFGDLMALAAIIHDQQPPAAAIPGCTVTAGSATVTAPAGSFTPLAAGLAVTGDGIPAGTFILAVTPGTTTDTITLTQDASASATVPLTFSYPQVSFTYNFTANANQVIGPAVI